MCKKIPSEIVKVGMKTKGWTPSKAEQETGIGAGSWRRWLKGAGMRPKTVHRIVDVLDLSDNEKDILLECSVKDRLAAYKKSMKTIRSNPSVSRERSFEDTYKPVSMMRL